MNKKIIFILSISIIFFNKSVFCSDQEIFSIEKQLKLLQSEHKIACKKATEKSEEKVQMRKMIVESNINFLERSILMKIKKHQTKLAKYTTNLNNSQNGTEVQNWFKKIETTKKKIKTLEELSLGIELLKLKTIE